MLSRAVSMSTGTATLRSLKVFNTANPSRPGSMTSRTIRSNAGSPRARSSASPPSRTISTAWPSSVRPCRTNCATLRSSSTTRILTPPPLANLRRVSCASQAPVMVRVHRRAQNQATLITGEEPIWLDRYSAVCPDCPDLVAGYEGPGGLIALLLRQTLVPLPEELASVRRLTPNAARTASSKLRAAGFRGGFMVLQWQPLETVASVLRAWPCRYEADPARRAQLTTVAERYAADERYLATQAQSRRRVPSRSVGALPPFATASELHGLQSWYDAMAPTWLGVEPLLRRALLLKTHRWIAEHILIPAADGRTAPFEIRQTINRLGWALLEMIPPDDRAVWSVWVGLVIGDLERAMRRPSADWSQAWARWPLLIAYSVPVPGEPPAPISRTAGRRRSRSARRSTGWGGHSSR